MITVGLTAVASNSNINSLVDTEIFYRSEGSLTAVNSPVPVTKWHLHVILWANTPDIPQRGLQKFETEDGMWARGFSYGASNSFGPWSKVANYKSGLVESVNSLTGVVTVTLNTTGT
ncbi:MAG: hypothetical protein [Podoviridae sp. ctQNx1]|nr:MAG: hypothetical protein [Podoviridae sp. ctQNx1]UOF78136.1 hypothetical protein [Caudoviricetes sp.]